jgi:putative transposase
LWEGRYRAAPIDSASYFLACCRYIELNPVRARMVDHPRAYKWSSYRAHADGRSDPLVSDHPLYRALGRSQATRQGAYRALFREVLADEVVDALRRATQGGWALGDTGFAQKVARASGRRAAPLPAGRPRKRRRKGKQQLRLL